MELAQGQGSTQVDGSSPQSQPFVPLEPLVFGTLQPSFQASFFDSNALDAPTVMLEQSEQVAKDLDDIVAAIHGLTKIQLQLQRVQAARYGDPTLLLSGYATTLNERIASFNSNLKEIEDTVLLALMVVRRDIRKTHATSLLEIERAANSIPTSLPAETQNASSSISESLARQADTGVENIANLGPQVEESVQAKSSSTLSLDPQLRTSAEANEPVKMDVDTNLNPLVDTGINMNVDPPTLTETRKPNTQSEVDSDISLIASANPATTLLVPPDLHKRAITELSDHNSPGEGEPLAATRLAADRTPVTIDDDSEPPKKKQHMIDLTTPSPPLVPRTINPHSSPEIIDLVATDNATPSGGPTEDPSLKPTQTLQPAEASTSDLVPPAPSSAKVRRPSQLAFPDPVAANPESKSKSSSSELTDGDLFADGSLFGSSHSHNSALPSPLVPLAPSPAHLQDPASADSDQLLDFSKFLAEPVPEAGPVPEAVPVAADLSAFLSSFGTSATGSEPLVASTSTAAPAPQTGGEQLDLQTLGVVDLDELSKFLS